MKMDRTREKIVIIDGSSYFFRAFFAVQYLSNSKGLPTNAIFGFVNMIGKVLEVEKPTRLMIAFDTPKPSFRKEVYAEYKANRERPPEDLIRQIPFILRAVDCFGIYRLEKEGYEADDVIASVTKRALADGFQVEIISGDKDLMQLVGEDVTLFDTMKDKRFGSEGVFEKFGVNPEQMVDFLALMGDSSDNVPGVSGIGKKTAAQLLEQFGTLDKLYEGLDEIKQQKRRETLQKEKGQAFLSRKLVQLAGDLKLDFDWESLRYQGPKREALRELLQELEFQTMLKRFDLEAEPAPKAPEGKYETIWNVDQLKALVQKLRQSSIVALDTETTSLDPMVAKLVGISFSVKAGEAFYLPLAHVDSEKEQIPSEVALKALKPVLEDETVLKLGQNLKYDLQILKRWGTELKGIASDTLLASYLLDPDQPHNLDALALRHLNHKNISYEQVAGKGKAQKLFSEVSISEATNYAAEDADITLQIHQHLLPLLKDTKLSSLFDEVEVPLLRVLAEMELRGVEIDKARLENMGTELAEEIAGVTTKIFALAGQEFNINSPKQLSEVLFKKLELPVIKKTKTGFSTDESVLRELRQHHEIAEWILKHREWVKLKTTYVDGLLAQINEQSGRIHTRFNQTVAATGRLSSSNPNLQNIPVASGSRFDIRSVFVAQAGHGLLSADYSQVELRVLAHMSGDQTLKEAFEKDEDVHTFTGKLIFGVDEISADQRRVAKTINFGVMYGQTPFGLSKQLGISMGKAKEFIENYFARYSDVKKYMKKTVEDARSEGYVTTLLGRRRYLREIGSKNRIRREMAERTAINTPIQGTAADMIKVAMIRISDRLKKEKLKANMLLQVHDELVFEVPEKEKSKLQSLVREEMEHALPLSIPLRVDVNWGKSWQK